MILHSALLKDNKTPNSKMGIALFKMNKVQVANAIDLSKMEC